MVIICFERSKILDYPVYLHSETYIKLRLASQGAKLLTSIDGQDNHNNIPSSGLSKVLVASDVGSYLKLGGQVVMCVCVGGQNLSPLVDKGLTDLPKTGWAIAHSAHPSPTPLSRWRGQNSQLDITKLEFELKWGKIGSG